MLLNGGAFDLLWYAARASGEDLCGKVLEQLYTERPTLGSAHPDSREPAAFSGSVILSTAFRILHLRINQASQHVASDTGPLVGPARRPLRAWLLTYRGHVGADLIIRCDSIQDALHFAMANVLGYFLRKVRRLTDPDGPKGLIVPPMDPTILTILHKFAIALLCLEPEFPTIASACATRSAGGSALPHPTASSPLTRSPPSLHRGN